ncbi:MAG TPA: S8 family serine peptidase [Solirubrobacteraceae bacterium]|nr:S8 family serine peptidase [Solirubrobacteraceae bacterium]
MVGAGERPAFSRGESIFVPLALERGPLHPDPEWAWGGATGRGVRVAVLDSGIDADHPALEGCVDDGVALRLQGDGGVSERGGPHGDAFGHGTACASIIHGIAPEARITSVKVLGGGLGGRAAVFLHGLAWAIEHRFDVINLSLGTGRRDWALPLYELCDRAYFQGCFVVTAASNAAEQSFPSLCASVASVACNTARDAFDFHANPEPPTEFLAPGIDVEVAWLDGGTRRVTGNSYAAPHIAGIAALVCSKHPRLRPFQLKSVLWATAANARGGAAPPRAADARAGASLLSPRATSAIHTVQAGLLRDGGP